MGVTAIYAANDESMYILYERTGTFVLKRKGEKFQKEESWLLLGVTQIISCVTQTMHVVTWSSSLQADQEFPKPTGSSKNLTDLSGNYRWK